MQSGELQRGVARDGEWLARLRGGRAGKGGVWRSTVGCAMRGQQYQGMGRAWGERGSGRMVSSSAGGE